MSSNLPVPIGGELHFFPPNQGRGKQTSRPSSRRRFLSSAVPRTGRRQQGVAKDYIFWFRHQAAAKSRLACAGLRVVQAQGRAAYAGTIRRERPPKSVPFKLGVIPKAAAAAGLLYLLAPPAFAQQD